MWVPFLSTKTCHPHQQQQHLRREFAQRVTSLLLLVREGTSSIVQNAPCGTKDLTSCVRTGGNLQDGLVGLAFPQLSASHSPNFVLRYAAAGLISTPTFCTCLNQTGGLLAVGGVADFMGPPASIQWTPLLPGGFYRVNVTTVRQAAV